MTVLSFFFTCNYEVQEACKICDMVADNEHQMLAVLMTVHARKLFIHFAESDFSVQVLAFLFYYYAQSC
jgi:hypothetical protein